MSEKKNFFETITSQGKSYVDGRITEVKLKVVRALSLSLSFVTGVLIFLLFAAVCFGLLAFALVQWLNSILGTPFGTLAVAALFAVLALIIFLRRKKLFRSRFIAMFSRLLMEDDCEIDSYSDLKKAEQENRERLKSCSDNTKEAVRELKHKLSPLNLLSELLLKSNDVIDNAGIVFKSARNLIRNITGRGYRYEEPDDAYENRNNAEEINNEYQNEESNDDCRPVDGGADVESPETPRD